MIRSKPFHHYFTKRLDKIPPTPVLIKAAEYKNDQLKFNTGPSKQNPKEKRVYVNYGAGNSALQIQFPSTAVTFNASYYKGNTESTPSVVLSLDASDPKMGPVVEMLNQIDEKALDFIHANAGPLMGKAGKSKELLRDLMKKTVRYSTDKATGEVKPYPPTISLKLYKDAILKNLDKSIITTDPVDVLRRGAVVTAIIQPTGVSLLNGTISVQYKLAAARIDVSANSSGGADFDFDDAPVTAVAPAAVAAVGGAGRPAAEVEEDEEDEIVTPAPVAAAPAEDEDEEEEILPPSLLLLPRRRSFLPRRWLPSK